MIMLGLLNPWRRCRRSTAWRRLVASVLPAAAALTVLVASPSSAKAQTLAVGPLAEVPFVTTPDRVTLAMLELAGVGPSDWVLDLGSGDGRIVITAARRFGAQGLGVEIDPQLVERSRANAQAAGVAERAQFAEQDLFNTDLAKASVITMYLLPDVNLALRPRLLKLRPGTRIVSHDWDMGDWLPDRSLVLQVPEKTIGREKTSRVHLWIVPVDVSGLWCGPGGHQLDIHQQFQRVDGRIGSANDGRAAWGHLDGLALQLTSGKHRLDLEASADVGHPILKVRFAEGPWSAWAGRQLQRAPAKGGCPSV